MRVWACVRVSTVCVCERMCVCARASPQVCAPSNTHATRLTHAAAQRTSGPRTHHAGTLHTCAAHRSTHSHTRPHSTPTLTMKKQKAAVHLSKPGARAAAAPADTGARQRRTRADQHRNTVRCARGASPRMVRRDREVRSPGRARRTAAARASAVQCGRSARVGARAIVAERGPGSRAAACTHRAHLLRPCSSLLPGRRIAPWP